MVLVCPRCRYPVDGPSTPTLFGPMHAACAATGRQDAVDALPDAWIALIYTAAFIPFMQPISFWVRRGLLLGWAERYPNRAVALRFHGRIADAMTLLLVVGTVVVVAVWLASLMT